MAPENSLDAMRAAADLGADMAEIDVRRTRDGVLVLHHNRTIRRRQLTALQYPEAKLADPHLATLDDAVRLVQGRMMLDVELKEEGYEHEVLECVSSYLDPSAFVVTSFSLATVERVKQLRPELEAGWIVHAGLERSALFSSLQRAGARWLAVHHRMVDPNLLHQAAEHGVHVAVWTVNRRAEMRSLLGSSGITALITDRPDVALAIRSSES